MFVKAGYTKKSRAKSHNHTLAIALFLMFVFFMCAIASNGYKPSSDAVQNIMVKQYTTDYTVELWNGAVSKVYVDWNAYDNLDEITGYNPDNNSESVDSCDMIDENNDEGQVCVITNSIRMWRFLRWVGY